ncbi:hypothetical protein F4808DRAFT_421524 [Astrocystis sublimbata]|nr:hypothetical protein F4808DRAFT_421524 [Astrocystis sublimbata]
MLFPTVTLLLTSLACIAEGAPTKEAAGLIVLDQFLSNDGVSHIVVYGDAKKQHSEVARDADLFKRCGSNNLVCDNSHTANRGACQSLINDLSGSSASLPGSPRSICGTYSGSQCCVSWHDPVSNAMRRNLASAAQKALNGCRGDTGVSAKTSDTQIGSTCTSQCLSDRATGC